MKISDLTNIPSLELKHNNTRVEFAFRTMEEIQERRVEVKELPHRHDYYTILWANNACGQHFIDYKEYVIKPNRVFFVSPEQVHQVVTFGEPTGVVIMFTRAFLHLCNISEDFLTNLGLFSESSDLPPLQLSNEAAKELHIIAKNINNAFSRDSLYKTDLLGAYLKLFLIECNKYIPSLDAVVNPIMHSGSIILKEFKALVENKFIDWHKVADYANKLNISPDYLNNVIKSTIGKTAKEFIQNRITLEAKRLGIHTHLTTKEVAFQLGFDDPSHFSKFFKNNEGLAFSEFRKKLEKQFVV